MKHRVLSFCTPCFLRIRMHPRELVQVGAGARIVKCFLCLGELPRARALFIRRRPA